MRLPKLCQKNHLFSQSVSGNNAIEYFNTIIATCRLCRVDPEDYLTDMTIRINEGHPMSRLDELLPWNWQAAPPSDLERAKKYVKYNQLVSA
ncbi:MAG: transposase domain-containing protein [Pseudobacteriovorax sp.]|nr:transposase domain-containing protein [Pseudobacteriovorax sp.]